MGKIVLKISNFYDINTTLEFNTQNVVFLAGDIRKCNMISNLLESFFKLVERLNFDKELYKQLVKENVLDYNVLKDTNIYNIPLNSSASFVFEMERYKMIVEKKEMKIKVRNKYKKPDIKSLNFNKFKHLILSNYVGYDTSFHFKHSPDYIKFFPNYTLYNNSKFNNYRVLCEEVRDLLCDDVIGRDVYTATLIDVLKDKHFMGKTGQIIFLNNLDKEIAEDRFITVNNVIVDYINKYSDSAIVITDDSGAFYSYAKISSLNEYDEDNELKCFNPNDIKIYWFN